MGLEDEDRGDTRLARGLPPVAPPSGRFIAQLFLVPGLIVTFAVLFILGINYLFVESRTAEYYLLKLDSGNPDIRWRGANDLAQELKRAESPLKADPEFALDLAERVQLAIDSLRQEEQTIGERIKSLSPKDQDREWRKLYPARDHAQFMISALGDFYVPVGVPLLCELAQNSKSMDVKGNALQRRKAVWALGNLGENLKGFAKLTTPQKEHILSRLHEEAKKDSKRGAWARNALNYLDKESPQTPGLVEVDRVLAQCARDGDPELRLVVALVLNFWDGPLVEPTLIQLSRDNGFGQAIKMPVIEP
jgi:hypothetical protein